MTLEPAVGVFLDGLIAVLLVVTITTGLFLNRRIERLRRSTRDINTLVGGFDKATARARSGIETLRKTLTESGEQLQNQIDTARSLRDDLKQIAIAGGRIANIEPPRPAPKAPRPKAPITAEPKGMPRAEPPWAELGRDEDREPARVEPMRPATQKAEGRPGLTKRAEKPNFAGPARAVVGQTLNRKTAAAMAQEATSEVSEVERELRELLRNVR